MSRRTELHNFKVGDIVTVFNRSFRRFEIEGKATITKLRPQEDTYEVKWTDQISGSCARRDVRYVDPNGQDNPEEFLDVLNEGLSK